MGASRGEKRRVVCFFRSTWPSFFFSPFVHGRTFRTFERDSARTEGSPFTGREGVVLRNERPSARGRAPPRNEVRTSSSHVRLHLSHKPLSFKPLSLKPPRRTFATLSNLSLSNPPAALSPPSQTLSPLKSHWPPIAHPTQTSLSQTSPPHFRHPLKPLTTQTPLDETSLSQTSPPHFRHPLKPLSLNPPRRTFATLSNLSPSNVSLSQHSSSERFLDDVRLQDDRSVCTRRELSSAALRSVGFILTVVS